MSQADPEEVKEAIWNSIRSPLFILGWIFFTIGPLLLFIRPFSRVGIFGIPLGLLLPLSAFPLWGIVIHRQTKHLYRPRRR